MMSEGTITIVPRIESERQQREAAAVFRFDVRLFHLFNLVIAGSAFAFGTVQLTRGAAALGSFEVALGAVIALNSIYLWRTRRLQNARFLLALGGLVILVAAFAFGGLAGTAAYWLYVFPFGVIVFFSRRRALILNALLYGGTVGASAISYFGLREPFYQGEHLFVIAVTSAVMVILSFVANSSREGAARQIEEQRARLDVLLGNMPAGVILFEAATGLPSSANRKAEELLGRDLDPAVSLEGFADAYGFRSGTGAALPEHELPMRIAQKMGQTVTDAFMFVDRPDGRRLALRVSAAPVRGAAKEASAVIAVLSDATSSHEADRLRSELVSLASHQLKTPLAAARWSIETLVDEADKDAFTAEQRATLGDVKENVLRMQSLVNDLLSVARMESGKALVGRRAPTDAAVLLREVAAELTPIAESRSITIDLSELPPELSLTLDGSKFKEALSNVVANAVKYSREGMTVRVAARREGDRVLISVSDKGIGIPKEDQRKVFERFFRASNVEKDIPGTGLGLAIVKMIVEGHEGRIWFESAEGVGTTFFIEMPATSKTV